MSIVNRELSRVGEGVKILHDDQIKEKPLRLKRDGWVPFVLHKKRLRKILWVNDPDARRLYVLARRKIREMKSPLTFSTYVAYEVIREKCDGRGECTLLEDDFVSAAMNLSKSLGITLNRKSILHGLASLKWILKGVREIRVMKLPPIGEEYPADKSTAVLLAVITELGRRIDTNIGEIRSNIERRGWTRMNIYSAFEGVEPTLRRRVINGNSAAFVRRLIKQTNIELIDLEHGLKGKSKNTLLLLTPSPP